MFYVNIFAKTNIYIYNLITRVYKYTIIYIYIYIVL